MVKGLVLGNDGLGLTRGDLKDRVVGGIKIATRKNNKIIIVVAR